MWSGELGDRFSFLELVELELPDQSAQKSRQYPLATVTVATHVNPDLAV